MTYQQIKNQQPVLNECFFAFSDSQFHEGVAKQNIEGKKILSGGHGLYGTKQGIEQLLSFYDKLDIEIAGNCQPQEVYDYEFSNHECSYTNDDTNAIKIVISIFGNEKAKTVKRRFGYYKITDN